MDVHDMCFYDCALQVGAAGSVPCTITSSPVPAALFDAHAAVAPSMSHGCAGNSSASNAAQLEQRGEHDELAWLDDASPNLAGSPSASHENRLQRRGQHDELAWLDDVSHHLGGTSSAAHAPEPRRQGMHDELAWLDKLISCDQSCKPLPDHAAHTLICELLPGGAQSCIMQNGLASVAQASLRTQATFCSVMSESFPHAALSSLQLIPMSSVLRLLLEPWTQAPAALHVWLPVALVASTRLLAGILL